MPNMLSFVQQLFSCLVMKIFALISNFLMRLGNSLDCLLATI